MSALKKINIEEQEIRSSFRGSGASSIALENVQQSKEKKEKEFFLMNKRYEDNLKKSYRLEAEMKRMEEQMQEREHMYMNQIT